MIIFLYGPDSYRRQKKLNKIIEEYQNKYSNLSCDSFNLESSDEFLRLKEFSNQLLIFDNKKLAILRNISEIDPKDLKEFLKTHLNSQDFTILISEENSPPPELKSLLKKFFLAEKFDYLTGDKWRFFIQKEAQQRKILLTPKAVDFLAGIFQKDVWGLINELEKIGLISQNIPIDVKDLRKISDYPLQSPDIFAFINAVCRDWSLGQKIVALEKLFIVQEEPVKIFNILASLNWLPKKLIQKLADYDVMVKSGKIDYEEVLVDLALNL